MTREPAGTVDGSGAADGLGRRSGLLGHGGRDRLGGAEPVLFRDERRHLSGITGIERRLGRLLLRQIRCVLVRHDGRPLSLQARIAKTSVTDSPRMQKDPLVGGSF